LDLKAEGIEALTVNGTSVTEVRWNNGQVFLPGVVEGKNSVYIRYQCKYSNDGLGLHWF
jgi:hypothetical protein